MNRHDHAGRLTFLAFVLSIAPVLIMLMILRVQIDPVEARNLEEFNEAVSQVNREVTPVRGLIYDRYGYLMAGNESLYEVGINLEAKEVLKAKPETLALTLSGILGVKYEDVFTLASYKFKKFQSVYVTVARYVPQAKVDELKNLIKLEGDNSGLGCLEFSPMLTRVYPEKTLASNILGYVNSEGYGYGVEKYYNSMLAGTVKKASFPLNPKLVDERPETPNGASLVLTIDRTIQRSMEDLIDQAISETGSESGTIVVLDPKTGEVMAMATTPRMDLNKMEDFEILFPEGSFFNRAVSQPYEPGSVYKVLTMAAAYDAGVVNDETVYMDTGVIEFAGMPIYNWDRAGHGPQTMQGCMQLSLNVCLAWVSTQLGTDDFYSYMRAFGIGQLTGIDLAEESPGHLKVPGDTDWYDFDLGANSFGQGVSATPLQMASAIAAVANDGKRMAPHVVRSIVIDGFQHDIEIRVEGMPIKTETARTITEMLARSLEIESSDALVDGYRVAGKTGTAEIAIPGQGYTTNLTNASFVGWGPADDPRFLVYVWLEKPTTSAWGSVVAAPVFREAVERLVLLMNLPPDNVRLKIQAGKQ